MVKIFKKNIAGNLIQTECSTPPYRGLNKIIQNLTLNLKCFEYFHSFVTAIENLIFFITFHSFLSLHLTIITASLEQISELYNHVQLLNQPAICSGAI